jgi:hypothetical protein
MPKDLRASMGVVDTSTSRGHNFCIRSLFEALNIPSKRSSRGLHIKNGLVDRKCHLGPQNGPRSSRHKKS